jgi:hypothetical protein
LKKGVVNMKNVIFIIIAIVIATLTLNGCGGETSQSAEKSITTFFIENPYAEGTINENIKTINLTVPYGTPVTNLVTTFTATGNIVKVGSVIQYSGTTANNFTESVVYEVVAENGSSTFYTVTVTVAEPQISTKGITKFSISNPSASGVIDEVSKFISVTLPYGTDRTSLAAVFETSGMGVEVEGTLQVSGSTRNDFTDAVDYTVIAEDGSTANYTVFVTIQNYVDLQSDAGDYIGTGQSYAYTLATAQITAGETDGRIWVTISGDQNWSGNFQVPDSVNPLQPGVFDNVTRYPFHDPAVGGLSWSGEGRGCNTLTGWFAIDKVTYLNGTLAEIDLQFEQHCGGQVAALFGQIHWTAHDTTLPPGPLTSLPNGLWQPALDATPASGNYIYLQSDTGDYIGSGQTYTYTSLNSEINLSVNGGLLTLSTIGSQSWTGNFSAMNSLTQLEPGYYGDLIRYPFHNPVRGGLSWYGEGRGCNTLTGWFVVDDITYNAGVLTAIDLRFEQHCEGFTPALHGQIHWVQ